ncbi:MAG TPA: 50S ribosomal protein L32 [bacterium]|nr:50S ribosomal protein L32 [bacterium]
MGIQKHRRSRMSGRTRRAHWKTPAVPLVECPQCHRLMRPHRVCAHCGYYGGREVVKKAEAER